MNDRKTEVVPILGINTSQPDQAVKDGFCEMLHNLRYTAGGWRNVGQFRHIVKIYNSELYKIIYKHPATANNRFIALYKYGYTPYLCDVYYALDPVTNSFKIFTKQVLIRPTVKTDYEISHFGNVLIIRMTSTNTINYFTLVKDKYKQYVIPDAPEISYTAERKMPTASYYGNVDGGYRAAPLGSGYYRSFHYRVFNITESNVMLHTNDNTNNFWYGESAVMATFRMIDGTTLCPSMPVIMDSYHREGVTGYIEVAKSRIDKNDKSIYLEIYSEIGMSIPQFNERGAPHNSHTIRTKPTLRININHEKIDTTLIDRVCVYATRIKNVLDYAAISAGCLHDHVQWLKESDDNKFKRVKFTEVFGDNKELLREPFYFVKDINISDFRYGEYDLEMGWDLMRDIEQNKVYEPNQSLHEMIPKIFHEYNGRLHLADIKTLLYKGYNLTRLFNSPSNVQDHDRTTSVVVELVTDNKTAYVCQDWPKRVTSYGIFSYTTNNLRLLAYPDYRAATWNVYATMKADDKILHEDKRELYPSTAINMAFHVSPPTEQEKYPLLGRFSPQSSRLDEIPDDRVLTEHNRLQVSALNNLFSLPFDLSYNIGDNTTTIITLNTVADQLSDSKFGEFPLYVFTDNGIWTLQNGTGEVVYSNNIPINHDRIINSNTVAAAYNVFYMTGRGLFALKGNYSTLLSEPINDINNAVPIGYFNKATLHYQHLNNEIIIHNPAYSYAYIYSISGGTWSTRDFNVRRISREFVIDDKNVIYTFENEAIYEDVPITVMTRPLKFGSPEFKRLETFIARLYSDVPQPFTILIEGSNDCKKWHKLRRERIASSGDITLRRTPVSVKYFRLTLNVNVSENLTLNGFHIELYHKFLHRLR